MSFDGLRLRMNAARSKLLNNDLTGIMFFDKLTNSNKICSCVVTEGVVILKLFEIEEKNKIDVLYISEQIEMSFKKFKFQIINFCMQERNMVIILQDYNYSTLKEVL